MIEDGSRTALLTAGAEGAPTRKAAEAFDTHAPSLSAAIRRAVPFMARRGVPIEASPARLAALPELLQELATPIFTLRLATAPGGLHGALILDGTAIAFLLEGLLGGAGSNAPLLDPRGLTGPQIALIGRMTGALLQALSATLDTRAGLRLDKLAEPVAAPDERGWLALSFLLGPDGMAGRVVLALAKEAFAGPAFVGPKPGDGNDAKVANALGDVEVELTAELGRTRVRLSRLASLRVGDTIQLDVSVGDLVRVRAEKQILLYGHPTTTGAHVAIRVERRHGA